MKKDYNDKIRNRKEVLLLTGIMCGVLIKTLKSIQNILSNILTDISEDNLVPPNNLSTVKLMWEITSLKNACDVFLCRLKH